MRKTGFAIIALCLAALFLCCGINNPAPDHPGPGQGGLVIKGRIASVALMKSGISSSPLMASNTAVQKVLVYRGFNNAELSPVDSNGSFSVNVERKACGLIFLNSSNNVVGYLSLASGIEGLPLMMVDSAVAQIDMKDINIQDSIGTPQHNPIAAGGEAVMTAEELAAYKLQSALFSTIIRNLDMNNDSVIDVLSDRPYYIFCTADFKGGIAPTSDPGDSGAMPSLNVFHFTFTDHHEATGTPSADLLTPDAQHFAINDAWSFTYQKTLGVSTLATMYHWVLGGALWSSFISGSYLITYDVDKQITFNIISPMNAENYIVPAHLWYDTAGTKIVKVHWKWKMHNGTAIDATRLMQKSVLLQFTYSLSSPHRDYQMTAADTECTVDVDADSVLSFGLSCQDLFGNMQGTVYSVR
jgi:hypothetical protein